MKHLQNPRRTWQCIFPSYGAMKATQTWTIERTEDRKHVVEQQQESDEAQQRSKAAPHNVEQLSELMPIPTMNTCKRISRCQFLYNEICKRIHISQSATRYTAHKICYTLQTWRLLYKGWSFASFQGQPIPTMTIKVNRNQSSVTRYSAQNMLRIAKEALVLQRSKVR